MLAHRVVGPKAPAPVARDSGRLAGRDTELTTLGSLVADLRRGIGQTVTVLGETGLGTRLIAELRSVLDGDGLVGQDGEINWLEAANPGFQCVHTRV